MAKDRKGNPLVVSTRMSRTIQLFVTCLVDAIFPQIGRDVVRQLEQMGEEVEFPTDQTCCGQPAYNAGHPREAAEVLIHNLEVLDQTEGPIVIPSGSCADFMIHHGPRLVRSETPDNTELAERVAARIREFTSHMAEGRSNGSDETSRPTHDPENARRLRAFYHPSCHALRGLGLRKEGEQLLESVDGVERVEIEGAEECCGFGGLFALEMPEVSTEIMNAKLDRLEEGEVEMLVGADSACLMHLEGGLRRRGSAIQVVHIASALTGAGQGGGRRRASNP